MFSEVRALCEKTYRETIKSLPIPTELKRSLKTHERVPRFIDNLARELSSTQFQVKKEQIESAVRDMTMLFVTLVERQKTEMVMSRLAKGILKGKVDAKAQLEKDVEAFEGLGTNETIQSQKGTTEVQRIDVGKNLDALKEISEH